MLLLICSAIFFYLGVASELPDQRVAIGKISTLNDLTVNEFWVEGPSGEKWGGLGRRSKGRREWK